jgi:hypothetical protein
MIKGPGVSTNIVFKESIQHPLTLFPTALGILGGLGTALFGVSPIVASVATGGIAIGLGSFLVNYFMRADGFVQNHLQEVHRQAVLQMQSLLDQLKANLKKKEIPLDNLRYAEQAVDQLDHLTKMFEAFKNLLNQKLKPSELTFGRYFTTADQVQLAVLDNLNGISVKLSSIASIDLFYIEERLKSLSQQLQLDPTDHDEIQTLKTRKKVRQQQMDQVNILLTYNEQALTQLAVTNAAIADMKGVGGRSNTDLNSALQDLEILAKRAQNL